MYVGWPLLLCTILVDLLWQKASHFLSLSEKNISLASIWVKLAFKTAVWPLKESIKMRLRVGCFCHLKEHLMRKDLERKKAHSAIKKKSAFTTLKKKGTADGERETFYKVVKNPLNQHQNVCFFSSAVKLL